MQYLITILLSLVVSVGSLIGAYFYAPLEPIKLLTPQGEEMLGTSITTIQSTDTLKNSRTTINDNFTSLNAGKIEISTTSLPLITTLAGLTTANALTSASALATVGTITSGTWSGTAIAVAKGGTGTTSPSLYSVMLGNGANGLTIASGTGTTGQFLTSNGAGAYPSWQTSSVNQADNYAWTGTHTGIGIVGEIIAYASSTVPTGFLACNGATVSSTTYANLFALLGYTYGGTPGGDFSLPDLRGMNILGYGSTTPAFDAMGETGGATTTTLTTEQMPNHTHTISNTGTGGGASVQQNTSGAGTLTTDATGGGLPHSNLDPFIVLQYIIKF